MQSLRVGNGKRRCAKMLCKKPAQMAAGHTEPVCELLDRTLVQRAIGYQAKTPANRCGCATPRRSSGGALWSTAQAGTQTGLRGRCCTRKKCDVFRFGSNSRADGPAIDTGRLYSDEKLPVESRVPRKPGSLVNFVLLHTASIRSTGMLTSHNRTSTCRGRPCTCI